MGLESTEKRLHELVRLPAGAVFVILLIPTVFTFVDWRVTTLGWFLILGWYLLIRWTLSESREVMRHPVYMVSASLALLIVPLIGLLDAMLGETAMESFAERTEAYVLPLISLSLLFVVYSAWTAARSLVIVEEVTAADRAVRWERTLKTFFAMYFWPIGVWWVQKRVRLAAG